MIHAPGGEQIDHGGFGAATIEVRLQPVHGHEGAFDVGRHHPVDVGGQQRQPREHPQGRQPG